MRLAQVHQGVGIAVDTQSFQIEIVAAGLALLPQPLATATEKPGVAGLERFDNCLAIGEADHQDLSRPMVLHHDRQQAVHGEVERLDVHAGRTGTPRSAR